MISSRTHKTIRYQIAQFFLPYCTLKTISDQTYEHPKAHTERLTSRNNWIVMSMPNAGYNRLKCIAPASREHKGIVFTDNDSNIICYNKNSV